MCCMYLSHGCMLAHSSSIICLIVSLCLLFEEPRQLVCYWFYLQGFYILLCANQSNCFQVHAWINASLEPVLVTACSSIPPIYVLITMIYSVFGAWLPAANIVLYIEFYCLHSRRWIWLHSSNCPGSQLCWFVVMMENAVARMLHLLLTGLKLSGYWKDMCAVGNWKNRSWMHCSYFHIYSTVLTCGKPRRIAGSGLFHHWLSIVVETREYKNNNCSALTALFGSATPVWILCRSIFVLYCFCLAEQYIIWSHAIRSDCLTQCAI